MLDELLLCHVFIISPHELVTPLHLQDTPPGNVATTPDKHYYAKKGGICDVAKVNIDAEFNSSHSHRLRFGEVW